MGSNLFFNKSNSPTKKRMKLFAAIAAVALAQSDDGRKKKNNGNYNNNDNDNDNSPTYNNNNGGGNNGGNNGGNDGGSNYNGGSVYGDPHFMVVTKGQEALCFDFQPPAGATMNLLLDPETNFYLRFWRSFMPPQMLIDTSPIFAFWILDLMVDVSVKLSYGQWLY